MLRFPLVATLCVCFVCLEEMHPLNAQTPLEARLEYLYMRQHPEAKAKSKPVSQTDQERLEYLRSRRSPEARREYLRRLREKQSRQPQVPVTPLPQTKIPEPGPKPKAQPEPAPAPTPQAPPERPARPVAPERPVLPSPRPAPAPQPQPQPEPQPEPIPQPVEPPKLQPQPTLEEYVKKESGAVDLVSPWIRDFNLQAIRTFEKENGIQNTPFLTLVQLHFQANENQYPDPLTRKIVSKSAERNIHDAASAPDKNQAIASLQALAKARGWNLGGEEESIVDELRTTSITYPDYLESKKQLQQLADQAINEWNLDAYQEFWRLEAHQSPEAKLSDRELLARYYPKVGADAEQQAAYEKALGEGNLERAEQLVKSYGWTIPPGVIKDQIRRRAPEGFRFLDELPADVKDKRNQSVRTMDLQALRSFESANSIEAVPSSVAIQEHIRLLLQEKGEKDIDYLVTKYGWYDAVRQPTEELTKDRLIRLIDMQEWNFGSGTDRIQTIKFLTQEARQLSESDPQGLEAEYKRAEYQINEAEKDAVYAGNLRKYTAIAGVKRIFPYPPNYRALLDAYLKRKDPQATTKDKNALIEAIRSNGPGAGFTVSKDKGWNVPAPIIYGLDNDLTGRNRY